MIVPNEEKNDLTNIFNLIDRDMDGRISKEELKFGLIYKNKKIILE